MGILTFCPFWKKGFQTQQSLQTFKLSLYKCVSECSSKGLEGAYILFPGEKKKKRVSCTHSFLHNFAGFVLFMAQHPPSESVPPVYSSILCTLHPKESQFLNMKTLHTASRIDYTFHIVSAFLQRMFSHL